VWRPETGADLPGEAPGAQARKAYAKTEAGSAVTRSATRQETPGEQATSFRWSTTSVATHRAVDTPLSPYRKAS